MQKALKDIKLPKGYQITKEGDTKQMKEAYAPRLEAYNHKEITWITQRRRELPRGTIA